MHGLGHPTAWCRGVEEVRHVPPSWPCPFGHAGMPSARSTPQLAPQCALAKQENVSAVPCMQDHASLLTSQPSGPHDQAKPAMKMPAPRTQVCRERTSSAGCSLQ